MLHSEHWRSSFHWTCLCCNEKHLCFNLWAFANNRYAFIFFNLTEHNLFLCSEANNLHKYLICLSNKLCALENITWFASLWRNSYDNRADSVKLGKNLRMLSGFIDHCFTQARYKVHMSNISACSGSQDSSVKVTVNFIQYLPIFAMVTFICASEKLLHNSYVLIPTK